MKKRFLSLVLSLAMLLSVSSGVTASAASNDHTKQADMLYQMGLFKGTGTNADGTPIYNLDAGATRMQGLIMLIRLLGEEEAALSYTGECPFTDVSGNSAKYAGYAYSKGYTTGTTATTFGNGPLKANAFLTFCLRALGYNDKAGDFTYSSACLKAAEVGMIWPGEFVDQTKALLRSSCVQISRNALLTEVKGSNQQLIDKLVKSGAVDKVKAESSGIFGAERYYSGWNRDFWGLLKVAKTRYGSEALDNAKYYGLEGIQWIDDPKSEEDIINNLKYSFLVGNYSLLCVSDSREEVLEFNDDFLHNYKIKDVYRTFPELMGAFINGKLEYIDGGNKEAEFLWVEVENAALDNTEIYRQQQEALAKALEISKELHDSGKITDGMSQQDIVNVYYRYMRSYGVRPFNGAAISNRGENMLYDTAYSALVKKVSACGGRTAAFNLFMHIEGIPACSIDCHVKGAPPDNGHGLTYLLIDGEEYVVDWGNDYPLQTLAKARSTFLDEVNEYSLSLARAATGYNK